MKYQHEEWKVRCSFTDRGGSLAQLGMVHQATLNANSLVAGRFIVPFRPHLFSKSEPATLHLTKTALQEDEVFMILAFIYSEARRQDRTVSPAGVNRAWH